MRNSFFTRNIQIRDIDFLGTNPLFSLFFVTATQVNQILTFAIGLLLLTFANNVRAVQLPSPRGVVVQQADMNMRSLENVQGRSNKSYNDQPTLVTKVLSRTSLNSVDFADLQFSAVVSGAIKTSQTSNLPSPKPLSIHPLGVRKPRAERTQYRGGFILTPSAPAAKRLPAAISVNNKSVRATVKKKIYLKSTTVGVSAPPQTATLATPSPVKLTPPATLASPEKVRLEVAPSKGDPAIKEEFPFASFFAGADDQPTIVEKNATVGSEQVAPVPHRFTENGRKGRAANGSTRQAKYGRKSKANAGVSFLHFCFIPLLGWLGWMVWKLPGGDRFYVEDDFSPTATESTLLDEVNSIRAIGESSTLRQHLASVLEVELEEKQEEILRNG